MSKMIKTFKEFVMETKELPTLEQWVTKNCTKYTHELAALSGGAMQHPLYRGMSSRQGVGERVNFSDVQRAGYICKAREGKRDPLDTNPLLHVMLDEELKKRFGWAPRSEGLFCFGPIGKAAVEDYGQTHKIFPMNTFKYIWNPKVADLYKQMLDIRRENPDLNLSRPHTFDELTDDDVQAWRKAMQPTFDEYIDHGLDKFMKAGAREIMMKCPEYLAIPV